MDYRVSINFEGQARPAGAAQEARELLLDVTGSPPLSDDLWRLQAHVRPANGPGDADTSTVVITGPMGGTLRGRLRKGASTPITDAGGVPRAGRIDLLFEVVESAGRFEGSTGMVRLYGTVESNMALLSADLQLDAPPGAWQPPNAGTVSAAEAAAGAGPQGTQPLSQAAAERRAEDSIIEGATAQEAGESSTR